MTLILKLDLDMVKMYLYTKNKVPSISHLKVTSWTDTQTDRHTDTQTDPTEIITYQQTRMVIKLKQKLKYNFGQIFSGFSAPSKLSICSQQKLDELARVKLN